MKKLCMVRGKDGYWRLEWVELEQEPPVATTEDLYRIAQENEARRREEIE